MTTEIEDSSVRGEEDVNRIDQLFDAAQMVQGFTYDLAAHLDPITTTELMLTSRRLERLAQRLAKEPQVVAALAQLDEGEETPDPLPEG
ncbi:hypothetical protein SAMN04488030_1662 [Aliiroseovarius halocynthiae]|uniref:Uncharacterized protein n=1 Tax=Aliiroseovarius halocynthiae TaxID=985055 RepID=A0A545SS78_9RHOB|nr:hypothetical protein [Aliiroseovarius halocynthiae]TQV67823.1 hypothetical protein FIL88_08215 [Aliiroseovarius halocynthiae]SMR72914.1 hypothetical protein SAMN04488030_1662 [Aliiroseovarius halocynthiae]